VLAGGLRPANVAAAAALDTWALDASSGVESAPGRKDPGLLRDFFTQRRRLPGRGDSPE
jgi:phosphoribosylanthranilate isomerase